MPVTLIVATSPAPKIQMNISVPLAAAGTLSAPNRVILDPSKPFQLDFPENTFSGDPKRLFFTATSGDRTPIPAWLEFDSSTLQFSGIAPAAASSSQRFDILLHASSIAGFSSTSLAFSLEIGLHRFFFSPQYQILQVTAGDPLRIDFLRKQLIFDGNPVLNSNLETTRAIIPPWLHFDPESLSITGVAASDAPAQEISVIAVNALSDIAIATIHLEINPPKDRQRVESIMAIAGQEFNYTIPSSTLPSFGAIVSTDLGAAAQWLQFNQKSLNIHGMIPNDVQPTKIPVSLTASAPESTIKVVQLFEIVVQEPPSGHLDTMTYDPAAPTYTLNPTASSNPSSISTPTSLQTPTPLSNQTQSASRKANIIIAVAAVCFALALIVFILTVLYCRSPFRCFIKRPRPLQKQSISRPIMHAYNWQENASRNTDDLEKGAFITTHAIEQAPQVELNLSPQRHKLQHICPSLSTTIDDTEAAALASFHRSTWASSNILNESTLIASETAHANSQIKPRPPRMVSASIRLPRSDSGSSERDTKSIQKRLSALAAKRGSWASLIGPKRVGNGFMFLNGRKSCSSHSTQSTSILLGATSTHPSLTSTRIQPPVPAKSPKRSLSVKERRASYNIAADDQRPLWEKRQSYIRQRAATKSPFFGAGGQSSSRASKLLHTVLDTTTALDPEDIVTGDPILPYQLTMAERKRSHLTTDSTSYTAEPSHLLQMRWTRQIQEALPALNTYNGGVRDQDEKSSIYSRSTHSHSSFSSLANEDGGNGKQPGFLTFHSDNTGPPMLGLSGIIAPLRIRKSETVMTGDTERNRSEFSDRHNTSRHSNDSFEADSASIDETESLVSAASHWRRGELESGAQRYPSGSGGDGATVAFAGSKREPSIMDRPRPTPRLRGSVVPKLTAGKREDERRSTIGIIGSGSLPSLRTLDRQNDGRFSMLTDKEMDFSGEWDGRMEVGNRRERISLSPAFI